MKAAFLIAALIAAALAGCISKSSVRVREQEAFLKGQQQAIAAQQLAQQPAVWFRGAVRNARVPWTEELTLTRALAAAEYSGALDPRSIKLIRQGQTYAIDIKRLLRGLEDPELEPGDIVEVSR